MTTRTEDSLPVALRLADDHRTFALHHADQPEIGWGGLSGSVEVNGRLLAVREAAAEPALSTTETGQVLTYALGESGLEWQWELTADESALVVSTKLRNTGNEPLTIGAWHVLHLSQADGGSIRLGAHADPAQATFFRWSPWDMRVERLGSVDGGHASDNLCHLHDQATGLTLLCAFMTLDRMHGRHTLACDASGRITDYQATCTFGDYLLNPGQTLAAETVRLSLHTDPYRALESWAEWIHQAYQPVFADLPPVSWICGAWADTTSGREGSYESVAVGNARALREKLHGFDVRYIWTSQANLKDAMPGNWLAHDPVQLPSGLPGFFRQLLDLGFEPGLWVAPYWFYREAEGMLEANEANLLRNADGTPICHEGPFGWMYDDDLPWYHLHKYFLDGTHPKSIDFLRKVFGYYREIGARYYMLDFLGIVDRCRLHDPGQTPLQAGTGMLRVIREVAGSDTHIQTAVSSTPAYVGLIDAARVGRDFGEGRPLQGTPLSDWRNANYVLHDLHYANTHALVQNVAANYFTHRKLYMNDFNLLTIDKPVPLEHARIAITVFGLGGGSPLMLGDDYRRIDPDRLRMVKLCLPRTRDSFRPADLFERIYPEDYCRLLVREVETAWDAFQVVAVFNLDDEPARTELDFAKLGLDADAPYRVFEFWNEEYIGTYTRRVACTIPPQACRVFRLAQARPYPWLLGTDLHMQQGAVEITRLHWDAEQMRLSGTATRPAGESGSLFFLMPRKMRLINHEGVYQLKELLDLNVIMRLPVHFTEDTVDFSLDFEPWELGYVAPVGLISYATEQEWRDYMHHHAKPGDTRVYE